MRQFPPLLIVLTGPTASGKTGIGIRLARHFETEIISFDSRQFYKELSIGTAKPTPEEMEGIPHHFIDSTSINSPLNVGEFERQALKLLDQKFKVLNPVLMVGGSGLYMKAVCEGLDEFPPVDPDIRETLNQELATRGIEALQQELALKDGAYYQEVDKQNPKRLIRALEVIRSSGKPYSSFRLKSPRKRPFHSLKFALDPDREILYQRINQRVDRMMEKGLLEEVRKLIPSKDSSALQTVGYQELFAHLDGEYSLERAVELIKRNSRRYAKRQMTWFRKDDQILFLKPENAYNKIVEEVGKWSEKHSIL